MEERIAKMFEFDIPGEVITSLIAMGIIVILSFIVFLMFRKRDPLKRPKGFFLLVEMLVSFVNGFVDNTIGEDFKGMRGFFLALCIYVFVAFTISLTGLPSPVSYLGVTLSLGLVTFAMIHITSIRYTKLRYFKRFIDPIPFMLPINLISMWAPLLSLTLRMFGNAIAGWVIMSLVYWGLESLSAMIFSFLPAGINTVFIAPIVTPVLHLYFDIFSGFIQTLVFVTLSMLFIAQEKPEIDEKLVARTAS